MAYMLFPHCYINQISEILKNIIIDLFKFLIKCFFYNFRYGVKFVLIIRNDKVSFQIVFFPLTLSFIEIFILKKRDSISKLK